jgi:hypothetical protein
MCSSVVEGFLGFQTVEKLFDLLVLNGFIHGAKHSGVLRDNHLETLFPTIQDPKKVPSLHQTASFQPSSAAIG